MDRRLQSGDTLIEVLLSIVILGAIIVGAITIMNRGLSAGQTAVEHSQVRLSVVGQIEMLRKARDDYAINPLSENGLAWQQIVNLVPVSAVLSYNETCDKTQPADDFYLTQTATSIQRQAFNDVVPTLAAFPGEGMWIEGQKSLASAEKAYVDFIVRACWQGPGSGQQRSVTAVRLYDPSR